MIGPPRAVSLQDEDEGEDQRENPAGLERGAWIKAQADHDTRNAQNCKGTSPGNRQLRETIDIFHVRTPKDRPRRRPLSLRYKGRALRYVAEPLPPAMAGSGPRSSIPASMLAGTQ